MKKGNLNEIIEKSLRLYGERSGAIQFQPGDLPSISFDPEQMSEVVHNLLQNALDAVDSNGKVVIGSGLRNDQNRSEAFFRVTDNGKGMDPQTAGQAFAPYFTTKQKGTGLGLAIVHRIITEHNGRILFESHPGKGTTIEIRLPIA
jgi:signal transduction histidine kinase